MENDANKKELRRIIKSNLDIGLTLKDIIQTIEKAVKIKITSAIDKEFIESEYISFCKEILLDEIKRFAQGLTQNEVPKVICSVQKVSTIREFQLIFQKKILYYNLLMEHIYLMNKDDTNNLTILMKNTCLMEIYWIMDQAKDELQFLERFIDYMSYTYVLPYFLRETQLLAFCSDKLKFSQLVLNILELKFEKHLPQFVALCDSARQLKGKNKLFFMDLIKLELKPYTRSIQIKVVTEHESAMLCVSGMNIVLSNIKAEIESKLENNSKIDEVSFVVDRIFHIDVSLTNKLVWHGKNIRCVAKVINVVNSGLEWDVSGMDNEHVHPDDCGSESTGDGKNGSDGFAGESGGNISILTEEFKNAKGLTISSNGGNGSKGQDGGNGRNGIDGASINFREFKDRFPTTVFFSGWKRSQNLRKTVNAIESDSESEQIWKKDKNSYYLEVTTNNGNKITFFHTEADWRNVPQSALLYKGALGSSGRSGGQAGLGGQGGYAGELSIQVQRNENSSTDNICIQQAKQGENGNDGKGGLYGIFGKNGWDVAWMDYLRSGWPVHYGEDENSTLKMEFYSENASDRVYSSCRNSKWQYAGITESRLEHSKIRKFDERQSSKRQRSELQQQATAMRQKANLGQSMKAELSQIQQFDSKSKILNLQSKFQSYRDAALQNTLPMEEQELKQSVEVKMMRNTRFEGTKSSRKSCAANRKRLINTKTSSKHIDYYGSFQKLEELESDLDIKDHVGSIDELRKLNFTDILTQLEVSSLSLFRKIAQKLPVYYSVNSSMIDLNARSASRYLVISNEDISESITHQTLGTLRQYLRLDGKTQRENIAKYLRQIQKNREAKNVLKSPLREFVLEAGDAEVAHTDLKRFFNRYEFHLNRQNNVFIANPDAIDEDCIDNDNVYESFAKSLAEYGCKLNIYLNFLAHVFDLNLRVYYEVQTNDFELLFDLNRSAKLVLYVSYKFDVSHKFECLILNDHLQELIAERRHRCLQYQKIIMDVQMFHTSCQLRNYLSSEDFLNKNHYSEDEIEDFYREYYSDEASTVKSIVDHFPESRKGMEVRLEKLTKLFSGQRGILYFMERHFANEAIRISVFELDYIVNYALTYSAANEKNDAELFLTWIFAAHDQENWIDEVILLELEDFYGKQLLDKVKWRGFLSQIGNKMILISLGQQMAQCNRSNLTMQCVEEILNLLSKIPNQEVSVDELELSHWPYVLKSVFWTFMLSKIAHWASDDDLEKLNYHVQIIENNWGHDFTYQLLTALKEKEHLEDVIFLSKKGIINDLLRKISSQTWMVDENHLKKLKDIGVKEWFEQMEITFVPGSKERSLKELTKIIQTNANTSESIKSIVTHVEKAISDPDYKHAKRLADIDDVINEKRKYRLRDTQKLAVLLLLKNEHSTLAQVSTGEGKTLIVVSATLIKALEGERVDIVTSSSVLAKRDAEINSDIYKHFSVPVSHNCSEEIEKRRTAYASSTVIYGELSNFQRDYLLDNFYGKNILGKRNFNQVNVIVDEVDSMLLDKGNNMLYLSHDLPGMDKLESVYIFIWAWLCKPAKASECFDAGAVREAVLRDLYGLITVDDISQIDPNMPKLETLKLFNCLVDGKIVDQMGKLKVVQISENTIKEIISTEFSVYVDRLLYLITDCLKRRRRIHMPNYLRDFVERHLDAWIQSAFYAFFMTEGVDYVVDVDRTGGASSSRSPQIIILDKGTGTDQTSSQWDEGLHQFLQLKHNCKITLQSLKAVFTSNVSFFKLYRNLYGLTGTLGSQVERDILTQIHNVDFFTVPTAKVKQLEELPPVLCANSTEWAQRIHNETLKLTQVGRSVLIIAETVKDAEELYNTIGGNAHLYTREYDEFSIVKGTEHFSTGQVIIATNLAGRGTDIKISEELRQAGGLHVILAYLPGNERIEEQAFGRTARCGDKGSAQLIMIDSATSGDRNRRHNIFHLKNERDHEEVRRLSEINSYYKNQIMLEEYCFKEFKQTYDFLKNFIGFPSSNAFLRKAHKYWTDLTSKFTGNEAGKFVDPELASILLDAVLETWAFWLDLNSNLIQDCTNKTIHKQVVKKFKAFNRNLEGLRFLDEYEWVNNSPIQTVKLGLYMVNKLKLTDNAIKLFDSVIEMEPEFSDSAHYYKAFALLKNKKVDEFKMELRDTMRILNKHSASAQIAGALVDTLKMENKQSILQIDAYKQQQAAFAHIYELILNSIQGIFGHPVTVQSLIDNNITIDKAFEIFDTLTDKGILTKPKVELVHEKTVQKIAADYGADNLNNFLSKIRGINFENEQSFKQSLKTDIILPSQEIFLKNLVDQKILHNEAKLVSFDIKSLETLNFELCRKVGSLLSSNELLQLKVDTRDIYLSGSTPNSEHILVDRKLLKKAIGSKWYTMLKQSNILSFHYKAEINEHKMSSIQFSHFDSISINDFKKVNIGGSEAEKIVNCLVKRGILRKRHDDSVYLLNMTFEEISELQLLPDYPVYENATYNLLRICFIYRQEFERMKSQLTEKALHIQIRLLSKPHNNIIRDLVLEGVLIPTRVSDKSLDEIGETLEKLFPEEKENSFTKIKNFSKRIFCGEKYRKTVIFNLLSSSKATLEILETPDGNLKHLTDMCTNLGMAEEFYRFSYNGYEQLVELVERKWSGAMLTRSTIVMVIGGSQVALGAVLQLAPVVGNVCGSLLLEQGVSDLMFLASSACSGHLTWGDYKNHKIWSIVISGVTFGVGAMCKGVSTTSFYGSKLVAPGLTKGGISNMAGKKLIDLVGKKAIAKAVAKNILQSAGKGIANSVWNYCVSFAIEKCLKDLSNHICVIATTELCNKIDDDKASKVFEDVHKRMGSKEGKKFVKNATNTYITNKKSDNDLIFKIINVTEIVLQNIGSVAKQKANGNSSTVQYILNMSAFAAPIGTIVTLMFQFVICYVEYLQSKLNDHSQSNTNPSKDTQECCKFKKEVSDEAKKMLSTEMQSLLFEKITSPLVTKGINAFKDHVLKQACGMYQQIKEENICKELNKAKLNFKIESENEMLDTDRDQLNKKYHEKLQKLGYKSRDPRLIAAIVREGIPMDMICVMAAANVIGDIRKCSVKIIVDAEDDLQYKATSDGQRSQNPAELRVKLREKHFESDVQSTDEQRNGNDCLYESLPSEIRQKISSEKFRDRIAHEIERNQNIGHHIKMGYHRLPNKLNLFGGRKPVDKTENKLINDITGETSTSRTTKTKEEFVDFVITRECHIKSRLDDMKEFYELLNDCSKKTGILTEKIIMPGKSEYQDAHSGDRKYQRAHIIQMSKTCPELDKHPEWKKKIQDFVGRTDLVPIDVNCGVGRKIDNLQFEMHFQICRSNSFGEYKKRFIAILDNAPSLDYYKKNKEALKSINNVLQTIKDDHSKTGNY